MKLLKISECIFCPHIEYDKGGAVGKRWVCKHLEWRSEGGRPIPHPANIPDWCPLEDASPLEGCCPACFSPD